MISNGGASYFYDAENRLIWTNSSPAYKYVYDGDGNRVEKCVAAMVTTACPTSGANGKLYWRGTSGDTQVETDLSGNAVEQYIFFNGQRIARRDISTNAVHYYFSDHLGTHAVVTNAAGTSVEQDVDYYPYGGLQHDYSTAQVPQNYKFTGKERDAESGLDEFGARYYSSSLGRFMIPDWAAKPVAVPYATFGDPQSLNLYSYVRNNPLSKADADGHCELICVIVIALAIEGGAIEGGHLYFDSKKGAADAQYQNDTGKLFIDSSQNPNAPGYSDVDLDALGKQATGSKVQTMQDGLKIGQDLNGLAGKANKMEGTGSGVEKAIGKGVDKGSGVVADAAKAMSGAKDGQKQSEKTQTAKPDLANSTSPPPPPPPPTPPPCALQKTGC